MPEQDEKVIPLEDSRHGQMDERLAQTLSGYVHVERWDGLPGLQRGSTRALLVALSANNPLPKDTLSARLTGPDDIIAFGYLMRAGFVTAGEKMLHITDDGRRALAAYVDDGLNPEAEDGPPTPTGHLGATGARSPRNGTNSR